MSRKKDAFLKKHQNLQDPDFNEDYVFTKNLLKREFGLGQIVGKSQVVRELHEKIDKISSCDANVLISGESGTGKEIAARAIHYLSPRSGKPFIPVNCGAIPESLFENELFGHVKGAFTDAGFHQFGLVREAEGGTLFLDEVGSISPLVQTKLLRLLEAKEYKSLGDPRPRKANIRIVAATNQDLQSLIDKNVFREDLFYRLNIVPIHIPPLRDRKDDIPLLIDHFIAKYSKQYNKPIQKITDEAMMAFVSYSWPGNIREVENKIQQIIVMSSSSIISSDDIQFPIVEKNVKETEFEHLNVAKKKVAESFEKSYLIRLLKKHRGNVVSAAKSAGKSRTGLWNLLKKHNLSPKQFRY